jgi:hypothetical protein
MAAVAPTPSAKDFMNQIKDFMNKIKILKGVINGAKATNGNLNAENEKINAEKVNLEARVVGLLAEKVKLEARVAELEAENEKLKTSSGIQLSAEDAAMWASLNSSSYAAAAADDFFVAAPVASKAASASAVSKAASAPGVPNAASAPGVPKAASAPVASKAASAPVASKAASAPVVEDSVVFKADKCCNNSLKFGNCSFEDNCVYAHSAEQLSGKDQCKFSVNCDHLSTPNEKGIFCSRSHPGEIDAKRFAEAKARFEETEKQRAVKSSQKAASKQAYIKDQRELGKRIKMCSYAGGCINEFCDFAHCEEDQILCPNLAVFGFAECTFDKCMFRHKMTDREKELQEAMKAAKQAEIEEKRKADKAERDAMEAAYFETQRAKLKAKKPVGFAVLEVEEDDTAAPAAAAPAIEGLNMR